MASKRGGRRPGAGRPKGSKNKMTLARQAVADVIGADETQRLDREIHARGHQMLVELERIALDPTQAVPARLMAAKIALPFMLPKCASENAQNGPPGDLADRILAARQRLAAAREDHVAAIATPCS